MFQKLFSKFKKNKQVVNPCIENLYDWIDFQLVDAKLKGVVAFCFNLYELEDNGYEMDLIGASSFDIDDEDWACDEVTSFNSRNPFYEFNCDGNWENALDYICKEINKYLQDGKYSSILKSKKCVAVGFVDGSLEILYQK